MAIWGRLIGTIFGLLLTGGHLFGGILGFFIGRFFDKGMRGQLNSSGSWHQSAQQHHHIQHTFFKTTFLVMGHLAKSDGRVSEQNIRIARSIMNRMLLSNQQKRQAIAYFNEGKNSTFQLQTALDELLSVCANQPMLLRMFLEIQLQAASADGTPSKNKLLILNTIYQKLGFKPHSSTYSYQYQQQYQHQQRRQRHTPPQTPPLQTAYETLEITPAATNKEIKRAYRKLMSQHHPDKLIAQGLPEEMIRLATDKTQKIRAAYEQLIKARNIKG